MAGTRCTVPTAQSASSTYREEGGRKRGVVAGGENAEGRERERELNKEGKKEKKTRDSDKKKKTKQGKRRGREGRGEEAQRITKGREEGEKATSVVSGGDSHGNGWTESLIKPRQRLG